MKQAELIVLADYFIEKPLLEKTLRIVSLADFSDIYADLKKFECCFQKHLKRDKVYYIKKNEDRDGLMDIFGIKVRISRGLIQFYFPILFKTWTDYEELRICLNHFLSEFLRMFNCREVIFLPSFWNESPGSVKNKQKLNRLKQTQIKITQKGTSFKRCQANLKHCIGEPETGFKCNTKNSYRQFSFNQIDSGKLCVLAKTLKHENIESFMHFCTETERECIFKCQTELRNNSCPFLTYDKNTNQNQKKYCSLLRKDNMMYDELLEYVRKNNMIVWNENCFFKIELHYDYVMIKFGKAASDLMTPPLMDKCSSFLKKFLPYFTSDSCILTSEYVLNSIKIKDDFNSILQSLKADFISFGNLSEINSWNQQYLIVNNII